MYVFYEQIYIYIVFFVSIHPSIYQYYSIIYLYIHMHTHTCNQPFSIFSWAHSFHGYSDASAHWNTAENCLAQ